MSQEIFLFFFKKKLLETNQGAQNNLNFKNFYHVNLDVIHFNSYTIGIYSLVV